VRRLLIRFSDWVLGHPLWWAFGSGVVLVVVGLAVDVAPVVVVAVGAAIGVLNVVHARRRGYCPLPPSVRYQPTRTNVKHGVGGHN
jgi:hypothetical protein